MSKCLAALILGFAFSLFFAILKGIGNWLISLGKTNPPNPPAEKTEEKATEDKTGAANQEDKPPTQ